MGQSLMQFLKKSGYIAISLKKSGVGHFLIDVVLAGYSITAIVDTGASNTVFDLAWSKSKSIEINRMEETGGGVGSSSAEIFEIKSSKLVITDQLSIDTTFYSMDLSHVNQSLALRGDKEVQAVIGADILFTYKAIIDYENAVLFLKPIQVIK